MLDNKYGKLAPLLEAGLAANKRGMASGTEPVANGETPEETDAVDPRAAKVRRAKVRLFFDKLQKSPTLMGYLNFTSPVEQVEAVTSFAELVGVPKSQLVNLLSSIKKISIT